MRKKSVRILAVITAIILMASNLFSVSASANPAAAESASVSDTSETAESEEDSDENKKDTGKIETAQAAKEAPAEKCGGADNVSVQLFYGASDAGADQDGNVTSVWTVNPSGAGYQAGHIFAFRINYAISPESAQTVADDKGEIPAEAVSWTIPKSILKDRDGNSADTTDWSIPSAEDVNKARKADGTYEENLLDNSTFLCYREDTDGKNYIIYNFRPMKAEQENGYIELSYVTTKTSFDYKDLQSMDPFNCTMTIGKKDAAENDKIKSTSKNITVQIDTDASVTGVTIADPGDHKTAWDNSWGNNGDVKPENAGEYYYLVWPVRSNISATQPYTFSLEKASVTSVPEGAKVIGYKFAGQSAFQKDNSVQNQRNRDQRWDYVLVAIPREQFDPEDKWNINLSVTGSVTPSDTGDTKSGKTSSSASKDWAWSKPVFVEPGGNFNTFKRGDGGARTGNLFRDTEHHAGNAGFTAGNYSRYDLETFNGYNGTEKTAKTYDGLDFASWIVGYPGSLTKEADSADASNPAAGYWKKNVKYVLRDEGVYLLKDADALISSNGSRARTIGDGIVDDPSEAIRLTADDFRIKQIAFDVSYNDAELSSSMTFRRTKVSYGDDEHLTFYAKSENKGGNGKDADEWTKLGDYYLKNGEWKDVDSSVSASGKTLTMDKNTDFTAYKVETENAHYYTEIFTVPEYELKDSVAVMNLIGGSNPATGFILLNNNEGYVYTQKADGTFPSDTDSESSENKENIVHHSYHSDTDYACVSRRDSSFNKSVVTYGNNTRQKYYTITWKLSERESVTSGADGVTNDLPQNGGTFYDLLPEGSILDPASVQVMGKNTILSSSDYTVRQIPNYKKTGRTMLVVKIDTEAGYYDVTFDTRHTWNTIHDYGASVYNPSAYETGNSSITNGSADDGSGIKDKDHQEFQKYMSNLSKDAQKPDEALTKNDKKFLYAENSWDIQALTTASNGLTKKARAEGDRAYVNSTELTINDNYSYELRYMNGYTSRAKDIVLFDSLENHKVNDTTASDWHGTLQSIDTSQIEKAGAAPVCYISTSDDLNIEEAQNQKLSDTAVWTKVDDSTDLSKAKAVAIDLSKDKDGKDFSLAEGSSIRATLYMQAPSTAPEKSGGEGYPYAYNGVYAKAVLSQNDSSADADPQLIHQDYTSIMLKVAADLNIHKVNSETGEAASGVRYRLFGTSDYGTPVDEKASSDRNGNITFAKVEKGSYTLQEYDSGRDFFIQPAEHTVKIDDQGEVSVDGNDLDQNEVSIGADGTTTATQAEEDEKASGIVTIADRPRVHADVRLIKTDSSDLEKRPQGAEYRLKGTSDYGNDVLLYATSDDNGEMLFEDVEKGTYELIETKAPEGYVKSNTVYSVRIDDHGNCRVSDKDDGEEDESSDSGNTSSASSETYNYGYTGSVQTFTAPVTGTYRFEAWGAQGESENSNDPSLKSVGGKGGYTSGLISLEAGDTIYVYVGNNQGSFNGAGTSGFGDGGGATDFRLTGGNWSDFDSLKSRIMVAGGGGGASWWNQWDTARKPGGYAGGLEGHYGYYTRTGGSYMTDQEIKKRGYKWDDSENDAYGIWPGGQTGQVEKGTVAGISGGFGRGGNGEYGSGGSGYYGGNGGPNRPYGDFGNSEGTGAGGSSFISGYDGCDAISESSTSNNIIHTGQPNHYSGKIFKNGIMLSGNDNMTSPGGTKEVGHSGAGYARITRLPYNMILDEPLHSFSFIKESTYDNAAVGGAEFSLDGTSDLGTEVSKTAASDNITGEVTFSGLEAGTYILKETKAPEGFAKSEQEYPVHISNGGNVIIDGLNRETSGNNAGKYVFYNRKLADKTITVTKVWNDGEKHTDPNDLDVTVQTNVPEAAQYNDLVWITNDDRLILHVGKDVDKDSVNVTFTGDTSGKTKTISSSDLTSVSASDSIVSDEGKTASYYVMDSITDGRNGHFANIFSGFTPGENLTANADFTANGKDGSRTMHCNSLFADGSKMTNALIAYGRHLQNLDQGTSGCSDTITGARVIRDIDWKDFYSAKKISSYSTDAQTSYHPTGYMYGILNNNISAFNGGGHTIKNIRLGATSKFKWYNKGSWTEPNYNPAALFPMVVEDKFSISNVTMQDPVVMTATYSNYGDSGVLIGTIGTSQECRIEHCRICYTKDFEGSHTDGNSKYMLYSTQSSSQSGFLIGQIGADNPDTFGGDFIINDVRIDSDIPINIYNNASACALLIGADYRSDIVKPDATYKLSVSNVSVDAPQLNVRSQSNTDGAGGLAGSITCASDITVQSANVSIQGDLGISSRASSGVVAGNIGADTKTTRIEDFNLNCGGELSVSSSDGNAGGGIGTLMADNFTAHNVKISSQNISVSTGGNSGYGCSGGFTGMLGSNSKRIYTDLENIEVVAADTLKTTANKNNQTSSIGGIAGGIYVKKGINGEKAIIKDCSSRAKTFAISSPYGTSNAGGLIGLIDSDGVDFHNDFVKASDAITIKSGNVGGLIGVINGQDVDIDSCTAFGGNGDLIESHGGNDDGAGGFIGKVNSTQTTIKQCAASSYVRMDDIGNNGVGGFIGGIWRPDVSIKNCSFTGRTLNGGYGNGSETKYNIELPKKGQYFSGAGGFIGWIEIHENNASGIEVESCFTTGSVYSANGGAIGEDSTVNAVGSFIGYARTINNNKGTLSVNNCYSTGLAASGRTEQESLDRIGFVGTIRGVTLQGSGNYYLKNINSGELKKCGYDYDNSANIDVTGASYGDAGTPFVSTYSTPAHPYDSTLGNTYPFDPKGFSEIYGDWPAVSSAGSNTGSGAKAAAWTDEENGEPSGRTISVKSLKLAITDVLSDVGTFFSEKIAALSDALSPDDSEHVYTTEGKDGETGQWKKQSDTEYVIDRDNDNMPEIVLSMTTDGSGNSVWTYTFAVEDDNQQYYIYEKMNEAAEGSDLKEGYISEGSDGRTALQSDPGVLAKDAESKQYTITNTKLDKVVKTGSLSIRKNVTGTMRDPEQKFQFTVKLTNSISTGASGYDEAQNAVTGTKIFGDVVFSNGTGRVSLGKDGEVTIPNLPDGITYTVTEAQADGYTSSAAGDTGTITADSTSICTFTNASTYIPKPAESYTDVTLTKKTEGPAPKGTEYTFHATFAGLEGGMRYHYASGNDTSADLSFVAAADGSADVTVQLKKDESAVFKAIPAGAKYQFREEAGTYTSSYTVTDNSDSKDTTDDGAGIVSASGRNLEENQPLSTALETADEGEAVTVTFINKYTVYQTLTLEVHTEKTGKDGKSVVSDSNKAEFTYTIHFENIPAGTKIPSEIGVVQPDDYGEADKTVNLKAGEKVTFRDIPEGVRYNILQEKNSGNWLPRFAVTVKDANGNDTEGTVTKREGYGDFAGRELSTADEAVEAGQNDTVAFYNSNEFEVPTGVKTEKNYIWILALLSLSGIAVIWHTELNRRRHRK